MNKRLLLKVFLLCVLFCQLVNKAQAQYAVTGTAGPDLTKSVYWLTWDYGQPGNKLISAVPTNPLDIITDKNIVNGVYTWEFSPTVRIRATISGFTSLLAKPMESYTPGGWIRDGLDVLYNGNNITTPKTGGNSPLTNSRGVPGSALVTGNSDRLEFNISIELLIKQGASFVPVNYPGMVIGDAETIAFANNTVREYFGGTTNSTTEWQLLNFRQDLDRQGVFNDYTNVDQSHYLMDISNSGKTFEIHADAQSGHDAGVQAVMYAKGATAINNLYLKGEGQTAVAIGFIVPFDLADAPISYGRPESYINSFEETSHFPGDGTYALTTFAGTTTNFATLVPKAKLYMGPAGGAALVDADGDNALDGTATSDNSNYNDDENALDAPAIASLNTIKVNQNTDITVTIPEVKNNEAGTPNVYLYGWIDFNGDGKFSLNERAPRQTLSGVTNLNVPVVFNKSDFSTIIKAGTTYARFRVTQDDLVDDPGGIVTADVDDASIASSSDGEVEDYQITITGATISGKIYQDNDGATGGLDLTTPISSAGTQLYAYLVNTGTGFIEKKATVTAVTGAYSLVADQNGSYNVVISTIDIGTPTGSQLIATILPQLPATWQASVDAYGVNNPLVSGIEAGTVGVANLQVPVTVSSANNGTGITDVNFGINPAPIAVANTGIAAKTNTDTPVDLSTGDSDPGGSVVPATIEIENPNGTPAYITNGSFTVAGEGTYTIDESTGIVTFNSVGTFQTTTTPVKYRVKDNFGTYSNESTFTFTVSLGGKDDDYSTSINTPYPDYAVKGNDGAAAGPAQVQLPLLTTSQGGAVGLNGSLVTYTPPNNFTGTDTYKYKLFDGVTSADINVTVNVKPTGQPDADVTTINQLKTTNVLTGTGADAPGTNPGGPTTITDIVKATNAATVVLSATTGSIDYTPAPGFVGIDTYTYRLTSFGGIQSDPITVTVNVKPTGQPDADVTTINQLKTTNVLTGTGADAPGTNPGGATIITDIVKATAGATVVLSATAGSIDYTPAPGFVGIDTYTYRLTSSDGIQSDPITVTMTVKPTGQPDADVTTINQLKTTNVLTGTGADAPGTNPGGPTTITDIVKATNAATVVLSATTGSIDYTPAPGFVGIDTYTYRLTSFGGIQSDPITVTVTVKPTGQPDADVTTINQLKTTNVLTGTGADAPGTNPGGPTTITDIVKATNAATVVLSATTGSIDYTPAPGFVGIDTYTYRLTSSDGIQSDPITVTITVVSAKPTGTPDPDVTTYKAPIETDVTQNDTDGDGIVTLLGNGSNGMTELNGKKITYTPNDKFIGVDTYQYTLTKNGVPSDPIPVTIKVYPKGTDDSDLTPVNVPATTTVVANDGYDDGNPVTINIHTPPTSGTIDQVTGTSIKYTPSQPGITTYKYTITQNGLTSAPITVSVNAYTASMTLTKTANNGYSTVGEKIYYTLILKNTGTVPLTNVAITDAFVDPNSLSETLIPTLAVNETKTITAYHTTVAADVTAGKFENQAVAKGKDPKGNDITKISDDPTTTSTPDDPTVVTITPIANASINLAKTGAFTGNQINYTFIITNNGGAPLNTITLTDTNLGLNGVSITAPTGGLLPNQSLTYNATYTLTQADKDLGAVNNTATVNAKDPGNNTVTGTGSTVTTVTTSPVATNDVAEAESGTPEIISVLTNDDAKGSTFNLTSIEIVSNPMHGTVVTNANGTVTYTPTAGYTGSDSFTYRVKDAFGYYTNTATVTITTNLVVELKIPTLFSPNGDGVNDGFVIKDLGDYAQNELIVINRWGNEVYRQANYQNSWSGTGLNEGTYFYIVRLKKSNGESWVIRKGYVTLIRTFKK